MPKAERTLVKSQPELWQLLDDPNRMQGLMSSLLGRATGIRVTERKPEMRLTWEGAVAAEAASIAVEMEQKGWGTRVAISAEVSPRWEGVADWLDAVFEELAEPEKRPFDGIV
jgi:hypothetical protein